MLAAPTERDVTPSDGAGWHAEWLAHVGPGGGLEAAPRRWREAGDAFTLTGIDGSDVRIAESARHVVVFTGALVNASEIDALATDADAARLVLGLFESEGVAAFEHLRGPFVVMVWDRQRGALVVARDQVGLEPMFYARAGRDWWFSPSPDVLVRQPGVSRAFDAVALSEWLCGWFPAIEDTAYRDVKRVPPGSVLTVAGASADIRKYWEPFRDDAPVQYLREDELDVFEPTLARAVGRTLSVGDPAILLSGGLDSIAVAVAAADQAPARGRAAPLALSLVFPDKASNEERVQAGVAARLGLEQQLVPFHEAVGPEGLVAGALALSASWPQPMFNVWAPAYMVLAARGAAAGRRLLLTGRGGDEWMTVTPYLLADQLRRGDVLGAWRLLQVRRRSNSLRGMRDAATLVWLAAGRPLAGAALDWMAPGPWHERRRRRLMAERPAWVAPDPVVRAAMDARVDRWIEPARPRHGFYHRESSLALRHPAVTHDMEETQEFGRRHGMRMLHPFWDVDLIALAQRVPPALLMKDGRSKWLLRRRVAARVPGLGLERRGKVSAGRVFRGLLAKESTPAWQRLGGPRVLADIGAVAASGIESGASGSLAEQWGGPGRLWTLLNLETWVRQRA